MRRAARTHLANICNICNIFNYKDEKDTILLIIFNSNFIIFFLTFLSLYARMHISCVYNSLNVKHNNIDCVCVCMLYIIIYGYIAYLLCIFVNDALSFVFLKAL